MIVICVVCGQDVFAAGGMVASAVCPCGSRCFKWDDEGAAAHLSNLGELQYIGTMAGRGGPLVVDRLGFRARSYRTNTARAAVA